MNIIKKNIRTYVLLCMSLYLTVATGYASTTDHYVESEVEQRINSMTSSVDLKYTNAVKKRIKQYTVSQRSASEVLLGRITMYFPLFEQKLREKGMPDDLKYLAVIESGLKPSAYSRCGASGLWQFMKPTARMYGMKITSTIDERRDPEKSTEAAVEYLQYLYERFGDRTLAMAAYNCGPGNMSKAIRKANSKDFWKVSKFLPRETRAYVPKFIAMSYLMNYYYQHDLTPEMPDMKLLNTATSKVVSTVNFNKLSKEHDIDIKMIKLLNPTYIRNYIPKGDYKLTLPIDHMMSYLATVESDTPMVLYNHING